MKKVITEKMLKKYETYLYEQEKSKLTIQKYMCDLKKLIDFSKEREMSKMLVVEYKEHLTFYMPSILHLMSGLLY